MESSLPIESLAGSVQWAAGDLIFEISTRDTTLLQRAKTVFGPWLTQQRQPADHCWQARRHAAKWELRSDSEVVVRDTREEILRAAEYRAVLASIEDCRRLSLHAALLANDEQGIVIVGPCEAGKTTLACALWQSGWSLLCDDATLIDTTTLLASPTSRRVSLRHSSRDLLGEQLWSQILDTPSCDPAEKGPVFHPHEVDGQPRVQSVKLRAIVFLGRTKNMATRSALQQVVPAHALLALLPCSNFVHHLGPAEGISRLQSLAETVPAFDLERGPLSRMVQSVETVLALNIPGRMCNPKISDQDRQFGDIQDDFRSAETPLVGTIKN